MRYLIATDTGGTFTDTVILDEAGNCFIGKALSTPEDFSIGVLDAIDNTVQQIPDAPLNLYRETRLMGHGTTVTTNSLLQRKGAKTGLLTTKGFEDTLLIGRVLARTIGVAEERLTNYQKADKPSPIVPVVLTRGLQERIDCTGEVLTPLDLEEVDTKVAELVAEGIEALAVCLLWSFKNPGHEQSIKEHLATHYPDLHVVISSDLVPVIGEYERANTAAINAYLGPALGSYLRRLGDSLAGRGFQGQLLIMQSIGGLAPAKEVEQTAVTTLYSGPAGGIVAAQMVGRQMGEENIITTDMGGTSFDVGLIVAGLAQSSQTTVVGRYITSVPAIEVVSIGAGGGSIAWIADPPALMVGPQSAGARPGPACYGLGGELPTVTDADVVLGYINPENFLGGSIRLDAQKAADSLRLHVAEKLGMSVVEAAAAVYEVVNAHMADLIRKVTIERGYDPREFTLFAFGGGGPTHSTAYGPDLGVKKMVIPLASPVFSAYGIAHSDIKHFYSASNPIVIEEDPARMDLEEINSIFQRLSAAAVEQLRLDGVEEGFLLSRALDIRYRGQIHELTIPVPTNGDLTPEQLKDLRQAYEQKYEMLYGAGASSKLATAEIITFRVDAIAPTVFKAQMKSYPKEGADPSGALASRREVYWKSAQGFVPTKVFVGERLRPGNIVVGPAVIELFGTTLPLHPRQRLEVNQHLNFIVTLED